MVAASITGQGGSGFKARTTAGCTYLWIPGLEAAGPVKTGMTTVGSNRGQVLKAIGCAGLPLQISNQVHGDLIGVVSLADRHRNKLVVSGSGPNGEMDGLVTNEPGVVLAIYTADCVPLFFYDPIRGVVGLAHAGWRGTMKMIGARMIALMESNYGSTPSHVRATIGPSIGPCCYEVDEPVVEELRRSFANWRGLVADKGNGHWDLNLWQANTETLLEAGIQEANLSSSGLCTKCRPDLFYSYRREGGTRNRMEAYIALARKAGREEG